MGILPSPIMLGAGAPEPVLPVFTSGQYGSTPTVVPIALGSAGVLSGWVPLGELTDPVDDLNLDCFYTTSGRALLINLRHGGSTLIVDRFVAQNVGSGAPVTVPLPIRIPAGTIDVQVASNASGTAYIVPSAARSSVPRTATQVAPLYTPNLASLLSAGTSFFIAAAPGAWTNIGVPTPIAGTGLILSAQNGGQFTGRVVGPVTVQISLDGATPIMATGAWQSAGGFVLMPREIRHAIPAGTQVRARAFQTGASGSDPINLSVSVVG